MGHSGQMTSDGFTMNYGKRISEPSFLPERERALVWWVCRS